MSKDTSYERDSVQAAVAALRSADRDQAARVIDRLVSEGDPVVVAELARQLDADQGPRAESHHQ